MPSVFLDDDPRPLCPMARHGELVGFSAARTLWRFGFLPGSDISRAFGVSAARPLWVLAMLNGRPLETVVLPWDAQPPARFTHILEVRVA